MSTPNPPKSNGWPDGVALLAEAIDRDMYATGIAPESTDTSAMPIKGLSERGKKLVQGRAFNYYAKARAAQGKREQ